MITRTSLANEIDEYDQQIADMNSGKKDCFDAYRQQLVESGMAKPAIKIEIEAVKAAIKRRRAAMKDEAALEERDALTDEIFFEIMKHPVRGAHARENIKEFDPISGEFITIDRDERRRARMSESMDDTKAFSAAAVALGLISEKGYAETVAMADAVAVKFGNGPLHTDAAPASVAAASSSRGAATGEAGVVVSLSTDQPEEAMESPRKAAEAVSERTAIQVEDETSAEATIEGQPSLTVAASAEAQRTNGMLTQHSSAPIADPEGITFEAVPPAPMKRTAFAACFPEVSGAAFNLLCDDIARNGIQEPIIRMGDVIVDGWARYNAARSLGIAYPVMAYRGNDLLLDVIRLQRSARAWAPAQELRIAGQLAKQMPERAGDIFAEFQITEEDAA